MKYVEFFQSIRDTIRDKTDAEIPKFMSVELGRFTLAGLRTVMGMFPESRLDARGRMSAVPATGMSEANPNDELPITVEFEPMLEAYVLAKLFGCDAKDIQDESLFKHWTTRFKELSGGG